MIDGFVFETYNPLYIRYIYLQFSIDIFRIQKW